MKTSLPERRIMLFTSTLGGGGAEKHVVRLANQLQKDGFAVAVAVAKGGGGYEAELDSAIPVQVIGSRRFPRSSLSMLAAAIPLRRLIREFRPDVVFSVLDHASCLAVAATRGMTQRPAIIVGVQAPPTVVHSQRRLANRVIRRLIPVLFSRADGIVALSEGVRRDIAGLVPGVEAKMTVIYNVGVDDVVRGLSKEPPPLELRRRKGVPVVLACGRLVEQKGFSSLLDAFAVLRRRIEAQLWILGEGGLRRDLEEQIERLGLRGDVWLPGFVSNPYAMMRSADVFVLSSLWEGFGNVIVEAMAAGAPVVSTDCPYGPAEILTDGVNGLLVPPADPEALSSAISRVLADSDLQHRLRLNGSRRAEDFSSQRIAREYSDFFQNISVNGRA